MGGHDADVRLYDAVCELLAAARLLHETAAETGAAAAIAPTLGCLDACLQEVGLAVETLRSLPRATGGREPTGRSLDDLAAVLRHAARAADTARAAAAEHAGAAGRR